MLGIRTSKRINWKRQLLDAYGIGSDQRAFFIENQSRDILYTSELLNTLFDIKASPEHTRFGNLVQCRHVFNTAHLCGTRRQCKNCRLKNALDASWHLQSALENIRFNQTYIYSGKLSAKWFTAKLTPLEVGRESYRLIVLREDTQTIQKIIDKELTVLANTVQR
jgi:hypothetical protein